MIADEITKVTYKGDGTTKSFPFSFHYDDVADIKAIIYDIETGVETEITSDYYIDTSAGTYNYPGYAPGQEASETEQPPVLTETKKIVIYRDTPETQLVDMGEKYPLPTIEGMIDKLTMIVQEHAELLARAIKVTIGDTTSPDELMAELNNSVAAAIAASAEATTKATEAGTSATNAAASATTATTEAEAAGTSATAAAGSATEAAGKVTECEAQVTAAQAVVDNAKDEITEKALAEARAYGVPIGTTIPFGGNGDLPSGFLLCDGASVSRTMYPDLFAVIGTTHGSVDDEHFNLPNLIDKFIEGSSTAGTEYSAGLPNITGTQQLADALVKIAANGNAVRPTSDSYSGALYPQTTATAGLSNYVTDSTSTSISEEYVTVAFDASLSNSIYGTSDTVQPPALTMRYIIKAFDGETAESALIDITQYANELNNHATQLANHATQIANKVEKITSIGWHNTYCRGKYLGDSITDAQNAAIQSRTYDDLFIGDYWTIGGVNYRIAAIDYYYNMSENRFTKGNIIVVPDTVLYNARMNSTNITTGGYAGSEMRTTNLASALSTAQAAFGSHLANVRILMTNATDTDGPSGWAWVDSTGVELMNETQVYGTRTWSSALKAYDNGTQKQQFPLFAVAPQFVNIYTDYWLQDVSSASVSSYFAMVAFVGVANFFNPSYPLGVRPAITLTYV